MPYYPPPSANGAPVDATYLTQTAAATLTENQVMGELDTGIVVNTTTTGVQSIAVSGTDIKTINGSSVLGSGDLVVTGTTPDIALSLLAPVVDETITAGYGAVIPRNYTIASGTKLILGYRAQFRIL